MHIPNRFFTKIRFISNSFVLLAALGPVAAFSQTLGWINWTAPGSYTSTLTTPAQGPKNYATSASGTLALPGGGTTTVSFTGEILGSGESAFNTANNSFWSSGFAANTFTSAQVPSLPTNSDRIAISGYGVTTQQLGFSPAVQGLTMTIYSLGGGTTRGTWAFNQPFTLLSQNSTWSSGTIVSQDCNGTTGTYCLSGKEFSGTIIFQGSITSLQWQILSPEYYAAFNVGTTTAAAPVTISGTVSGLDNGKSVVLQNNGSDNKTVSANGAFTFTNGITSGSTYNVTVLTQPSGQTCSVTDGSSTANANVTNVAVTCVSTTYNITTAVSPAGAGTISCTPNPVTSGGSTTCSATAASGYTFSAYSGDCSGATCTLSNVTSAKSVTATFTQNVSSIPTLSEWAMIILGSLMGLFAFGRMRRQ